VTSSHEKLSINIILTNHQQYRLAVATSQSF
jgi:hypothetical protein